MIEEGIIINNRNIMASIFFILILLATYHFVYESILLPTFRLNLRYKLFDLRDRLIQLRADKENKANEIYFDQLERNINTTIKHMPIMTISLIRESEAFYKSHPEIENEIQKKIKAFDSLEDNELKIIQRKTVHYGIQSFIYNSGAWIVYLLPLFVIYVFARLLNISLFKLGQKIQKLTVTPEHQFNKITNIDYQLS